MKKISILLSLTVISLIALGQDDDDLTVAPEIENIKPPSPIKATMDLEIRTAFTSGEFKDAYSKSGMGGAGVTLVFPIKQTVLELGMELGYYFMGATSETFDYYATGVGDYQVNSSFSGSMIPIHIVARIDPLRDSDFPIHPYIEGVAGWRFFKLEGEFDTYLYQTEEYLPTEKETINELSWSYGFGGGVKVRLSKELYLNAKAHKIFGGTAEYTDTRSIEFYSDNTYSFDTTKSKTDVLRFTIGISLYLQ